MKILFWMISFALVAFELAAGLGKVFSSKMAVETWVNRLGVAKPFMNAFGGLEVGAIGIILSSLFVGGYNAKLVPWACLGLIILKGIELILQFKAREPFAAMVGPIVVIVLTILFYLLRQTV